MHLEMKWDCPTTTSPGNVDVSHYVTSSYPAGTNHLATCQLSILVMTLWRKVNEASNDALFFEC